jgi:hypothetical protein
MLELIFNIKYSFDQFYFNFKNSIFTGYYSKIGIYERNTQKFTWIYDYDNFIGCIWIFILTFFNTPDLLPYDFKNDEPNNIIIGKYYHNNEIHNKIAYVNQEINQENNTRKIDHQNLVYFVIDDKYDLTQEYKCFKAPLINYKDLTVRDLIYILSHYNKKKVEITEKSVIKIMADDHHFEEITYTI